MQFTVGSDVVPICVDEYRSSATEHLKMIVKVFREQFGITYRRQSINTETVISADLTINAHANTTPDGIPVITVNLGLLFALEDLWQSVISDNHTDLALWLGSEDLLDGYSPPVFRSVELFNAFDQTRYVDYRDVFDLMEAVDFPDDSSKSVFFINSMFKLLSSDERRRHNAGILADLSLQWILAHEDAHIYLGHSASIVDTLGMAMGELTPSESKARMEAIRKLRNYEKQKDVRVIAEMHADRMACFRLIDYIFDMDTFYMFPFLPSGRDYVISNLKKEAELTDPEANLIVIFRIALSIGISGIALFQRNIEKLSLVSDFYPDLETRIANIIFSVVLRIEQRQERTQAGEIKYQPFDFCPSILHIAYRVIDDFNVMYSYLIDHPVLVKDPDLQGKQFKFTKIDPNEDNIIESAFFFAKACILDKDLSRAAHIAKQCPALQRLTSAYVRLSEISNEHFYKFQQNLQAHIPVKVDEMRSHAEYESDSARRLSLFIDILSDDESTKKDAMVRLMQAIRLEDEI